MITEDEFYNLLLKEKENDNIKIFVDSIDIIPNYKLRDSPDFVLKMKFTLLLLSQKFEIEIPIPIELEKIGINPFHKGMGAFIDLEKFVKREKFNMVLPMLVISNKKIITFDEEMKLKTIFKIKQIPSSFIVRHETT